MILQKRDRLINIYTDGACFGNPGPGGWAFIYYINDIKIQNSGGEPLTTNNRMELIAVIKALKEVTKFSNVVIFSDSKYVVEGATKWINNWRKNNWKNSKRELIKNFDLWTKLDQILLTKKIEWKWVKAHAGNVSNEAVDSLAKKKASKFID